MGNMESDRTYTPFKTLHQPIQKFSTIDLNKPGTWTHVFFGNDIRGTIWTDNENGVGVIVYDSVDRVMSALKEDVRGSNTNAVSTYQRAVDSLSNTNYRKVNGDGPLSLALNPDSTYSTYSVSYDENRNVIALVNSADPDNPLIRVDGHWESANEDDERVWGSAFIEVSADAVDFYDTLDGEAILDDFERFEQ